MKNKRGFTLVELIVVIAILGILALFLIPSFITYTKDAQKATCESNRNTIERSYAFYRIQHEESTLTSYMNSADSLDYQEVKCTARGTYIFDDKNAKILCTTHDAMIDDGVANNPENPDVPDGNQPEKPKIPGTDIEIDYSKVLQVTEGEDKGYSVAKNTIVEIKDKDGNIINYYIAKNDNYINLAHGMVHSNFVELTNEKAVTVNGTGLDSLQNALGNSVKEGQKIIYDGKYYVCAESIGNLNWFPDPISSWYWVEIK